MRHWPYLTESLKVNMIDHAIKKLLLIFDRSFRYLEVDSKASITLDLFPLKETA